MDRTTGDIAFRDQPTQDALVILESFSRSAQLPFDRLLAGRALSEAARAMPDESAVNWTRRFVEVGESLNLRIRCIDCTLREVLTFVSQGIPVALCQESNDGLVRWWLIAEVRGARVRLKELGGPHEDSWVSRRALARRLGFATSRTRAPWLIGQPALTYDHTLLGDRVSVPSGRQSGLKRLAGLMRVERGDLWIILVFGAVVGLLALATPVAVEALVNTVAFGRFVQPIIILSLLLFTCLAFAAAMRGLITYVVELLQRRFFVRVVEDLAYRLPRVRGDGWGHSYGPELVNRFFDVVTVQKSASSLLIDGLAIALNLVIGMTVLAFYHPFLLGFSIVLLLCVAFGIFVLGRGAIGSSVTESKKKYAVADWLEELARHPTAFKLHGGQRFALERADQLAVDYLEARRVHFRILMRQILYALGLQVIAATVLLGLGGWLVIDGQLTLGQLVAAELIVTIIVGSFAKFGKHMDNFYDLIASLDKLGQLFDLPVEPHDKWFHLREAEPASVTLRDVHFHYLGGRPVLHGVNLHVRQGEHVAIVGPAGCGKSTLIDLICGLREPDSGHVELDGIDIRELRPDSLREHLGVARSVEIFAGTIEENVHLNRPHLSARDVRDALETVGILDQILDLPEGLNTQLQTGGRPLTDSQAAQLMLARAVVSAPRLLLIDGTLDALSDEDRQRVMRRLVQNAGSQSEASTPSPWTLLVTTGRRDVAQNCTRCFSLDTKKDRAAAESELLPTT
jgi:ABC-type bacteriocin/lantibiotic exporter with double-glycine peptidase domain